MPVNPRDGTAAELRKITDLCRHGCDSNRSCLVAGPENAYFAAWASDIYRTPGAPEGAGDGVGDHLRARICDRFPRFGVVGGGTVVIRALVAGMGDRFPVCAAEDGLVQDRYGLVDSSACALSTPIVVDHEAVDGDDRSFAPPTRGAGGVAAVAEGACDVFEGIAAQGLGQHAGGPMDEDRPRLRCRRFPAVLVLGAGLAGSPAAALGAACLLAFLGLLAAPGIAVDGDDLGVVDEAVDQGDDAGGVGEGLAPLGERSVGGDSGRSG